MESEKTWWLQISSGRGPAECCWVVGKLAAAIIDEAQAKQLDVRMLEAVPGPAPDTFLSILLSVQGPAALRAEQFTGTVQWIGKSSFRPGHKRKNWFVGVEILDQAEDIRWDPREVKIEVMRSSGPGGQHVNKTESAVRVTHLPSGLSAVAQEERSQYLNRKLAMARLAALFEQQAQEDRAQEQHQRWQQHNQLERGNPVRVYAGQEFRLRK